MMDFVLKDAKKGEGGGCRGKLTGQFTPDPMMKSPSTTWQPEADKKKGMCTVSAMTADECWTGTTESSIIYELCMCKCRSAMRCEDRVKKAFH